MSCSSWFFRGKWPAYPANADSCKSKGQQFWSQCRLRGFMAKLCLWSKNSFWWEMAVVNCFHIALSCISLSRICMTREIRLVGSILRAAFYASFLSILLPSYLPSYLSSFLSIFLPIYFPSYLSSFLSIFLPIYIPSYLSSFLSIFLPIYLPSYQSSFLSISLPIYLPSHLSSFLPIFLFMRDLAQHENVLP